MRRNIYVLLFVFLLVFLLGPFFPSAFSDQRVRKSTPAGLGQNAKAASGANKNKGENKDENKDVMTDIHDIKPPEKYGLRPEIFRYLPYIIAGILIAGLIAAGVWFYRKKRKNNEPTQVTAMLAPDEEALNLLRALAGFKDSGHKEYYFRLSAILRGYIHGRFNMNAPEMTTEELVPKIEKLQLDKKMKQGVKDLLHASDPIKFAAQNADKQMIENDFQFVENFVKQTSIEKHKEENLKK